MMDKMDAIFETPHLAEESPDLILARKSSTMSFVRTRRFIETIEKSISYYTHSHFKKEKPKMWYHTKKIS